MTYGYENLKLEKGMYAQSGKSFSKVLESLDPSENYRGTALEGLDAFQRQLKRFDIHVKGAGSDMVEKFFHTTDSAVLFPEFVSRVVRQGMESDILPEITATTTNFDGMDYRTIASVPTDDDKALRRVEEGAVLPTTAIRTQENLVKLHKRGRMLVASYEAIRFQRLDLFSVTLRQIGAYIARMHLDDAVQVLMNGDGNNNAADAYEIGSGSGKISGTAGTLTYSALLEFWSKFDPYSMNTMLVSNDVMLQMLKLSEFQNPLTGLNFQGTGTLSTPLGAKLLRTSAVPAGKLIGLDKNYALEHICGSEVMVEYDKLIDRGFDATLKNEYAGCDAGVTLECAKTEAASAVSAETTSVMLHTLLALPQGVEAMNVDFPGLVQTSLNLGVMHLTEDGLHFSYSIRSCIASQKAMLAQRVHAIVEFAGGTVSERGNYPGWQYERDSKLRELVLGVYRDLTGAEAKLEATHGGLECGIFIEKIPGLDAISLGPELHDVHSVRERLSVPSTERVYELVCEVLRRSR